MFYSFSEKGNSKTDIPTTMSYSQTCPKTCPFITKGCYAKAGHIAIWWRKLDQGIHPKRLGFDQLLDKIRCLQKGALWRHNQAGDLVHHDGAICEDTLTKIISANKNKKGFTYTHHALTPHNVELIKKANEKGFTINVSCNNLQEVDQLREREPLLPLVTVLPSNTEEKEIYTEKGARVVVCPSQTIKSKDVTCKDCKICANSKRDYVVGFIAHGIQKKAIDKAIDQNLIKTIEVA